MLRQFKFGEGKVAIQTAEAGNELIVAFANSEKAYDPRYIDVDSTVYFHFPTKDAILSLIKDLQERADDFPT
jgi:hypothetical protein